MIDIQPLELIVNTEASLPDRYKNDSLIFIAPNDSFVISRTEEGKTLSTYGDNIWDFNTYKSNPSQYGKIYFKQISKNHNYLKDSKKLLLALIILGSGRKGSTYSIETIKVLYNSGILHLMRFSNEKNITIKELLENNTLLLEYVNRIKGTIGKLNSVNTILKFLHSTDNRILQIEYAEDKKLMSIIQNNIHEINKNNNQTLVIPSRILANSIKQRWQQITEIEDNLSSIVEFTQRFLCSHCFAIASSNYRKFNCHNKPDSCTIEEALVKYRLEPIFKKYGIRKRGMFQGFIKKVQGTCAHLIHAYTGMRYGEVLSLQTNCIAKLDNKKTARIISTTTKIAGGKQEVQWVTTKEIERIINILSSINSVILEHHGIQEEDSPLFIKTSLLASTPKNIDKYNIASIGFKDIDQLPMNEEDLLIKEEDIVELENIDYKMNFEHHGMVTIGKSWQFKTHQYRRSLAVYAIQSGIVSLGALQIQFKHLFKEMSMYYAKGTSSTKNILEINTDHIANDIVKMKPEIDALSFIKEVIFSDEHLFGTGGVFVEKNIKNDTVDMKRFLLKNRDSTIKMFKNGDIAYKETALGGCLSTQACNEHITRSLTACANCTSGVIKISKLNNIIEKQKKFISYLNENSIEYRTESWQLKELESQKRILIGEKL